MHAGRFITQPSLRAPVTASIRLAISSVQKKPTNPLNHPRERIPSVSSGRQSHTMAAEIPPLRFKNPTILVCDLQEKFSKAIYGFNNVVLTSKKILHFAKAANIPVHCTTQISSKLGPTVPSLAALLPNPPIDKSRFSMLVPPLVDQLPPGAEVALVGIETHICITQTALDLRDAGHKVYILADGVGSCNRAEYIIALDRLRAEPGINVTTSESWMYECVGDAAHPAFKAVIGVVKESMEDTKKVLDALVSPPPPGPPQGMNGQQHQQAKM